MRIKSNTGATSREIATKPLSTRSIFVAFVIAGACGLTLAGCVTGGIAPSSTPAPTVSATPGASAPPAVAADPILVAGGTAAENKPYFDLVNNRLFAANSSANGQQIIENLVAAGFTKANMQLTPDRTVGNLQADSILFSVTMNGTCLLGQHGGGGYSSAAQKALAGGGCLIGKTRAIDF